MPQPPSLSADLATLIAQARYQLAALEATLKAIEDRLEDAEALGEHQNLSAQQNRTASPA